MIPWVTLDRAKVPDADGELRLKRRGDEFSIMLDTNELMNSRLSGSEAALATLACKRIETRQHPRVLIGGLGMGFTLRAALAVLPPTAEIVIVELMPAVISWAKGPMAALFGDSLTDARLDLREADVGDVIRASRAQFDAILLDVDNGPEALTRAANDGLYDARGLREAHTALRPDGVLAVWSSGPNPVFTTRLRDCGFDPDEIAIRATGKRGGARHVIWMARRRA